MTPRPSNPPLHSTPPTSLLPLPLPSHPSHCHCHLRPHLVVAFAPQSLQSPQSPQSAPTSSPRQSHGQPPKIIFSPLRLPTTTNHSPDTSLDTTEVPSFFHHRRTTPNPPTSFPSRPRCPAIRPHCVTLGHSKPSETAYSPHPLPRPPHLRLPQHIVDFSTQRLFSILDCSPQLLAHPR